VTGERQLTNIAAAGIVHDFSNLLTVIINHADCVANELPPATRLRADVEEIRRAAAGASALIRGLLGESGAAPLRREPVDLVAVLDGVVRQLRPTFGTHIELVAQHPEELWPVHTDRAQVEQIVLNLVVNACGAMPSGGRLTFRTANLDGAAPRVRLQIGDTGCGMSAAVVARAFEPFFTTKAAEGGTGLGLAAADTTARRLGGRIELRSEPGAGTTATLELPAGVPRLR
jgi:signal transduction histidine kinase